MKFAKKLGLTIVASMATATSAFAQTPEGDCTPFLGIYVDNTGSPGVAVALPEGEGNEAAVIMDYGRRPMAYGSCGVSIMGDDLTYSMTVDFIDHGTFTGTLSDDGTLVSWDNDTVWVKE